MSVLRGDVALVVYPFASATGSRRGGARAMGTLSVRAFQSA